MKIIKTTLGWEIQPQTSSEEAHVKWLLDSLATRPVFPIVKDKNIPVGLMVTKEMLQRATQEITCPRCFNFGCYNGTHCSWCGHETTGNTSLSNFVRCVE